MYKGFFEDIEYVAGLFFKPFEDCCEKEDSEDGDEEKCEMGCDQMPCCKDEDDEKEGEGCDCMPCCREDDEDEEDSKSSGGFMGPGPLTDVLKCMFDASDIDYDYED